MLVAEFKEEIKMNAVIKIPCEIYSRVTGYYRPVQSWNKGKTQEFCERNVGNLKEALKQ